MNEPAFFAIIPASVRYDKSVCPNAKLLYGELSALCQSMGFCWAKNAYFAKLYDVSPTTISEWVSQLKKAGHINVDIDPAMGNERKVTLIVQTGGGLRDFLGGSSGKAEEGSSGKAEAGIIDNRTIRIEKAAPLILTAPPLNGSKRPKGDLFVDLLPPEWVGDFDFGESWKGYVDMRSCKWPLTERAVRIIVKKLRAFGKDRACLSLDASTVNNWRDLYEPKSPPPPTGIQKPTLYDRYPEFIQNHPQQTLRSTTLAEMQSPRKTWLKSEYLNWLKTGKYEV